MGTGSSSTGTYTYNTAGTYTVEVTVTSDVSGKSTTKKARVYVE